MFIYHIAEALSLIALTGGASLYIWGFRNTGAGTCLARFIGFIVMIFSILSFVCSTYLAYCILQHGGYAGMVEMHQRVTEKTKVDNVKDMKNNTLKKTTKQ